MPPKKDELAKEISQLTEIIRVRGSLKRRFLDGIMFGLGSAIGATLIAGIVIFILSRIFEATGFVEVIETTLPMN
jgi:hypothetical protein